MRLLQFIVNCVTKVTHSDSGSGRTPHLNDLWYTIRYVALVSIVGYRVSMCGYVRNISVLGNGCGCRRSSDGSGITSTVVRDKGMYGSFLHGNGGVL